MKCLLPILLISYIISIQTHVIKNSYATKSDKEPWELIESLTTGSGSGFNGTWINDEEFYYISANRSIHIYNAANDTDINYVSSELLEIYKTASSFILSPDTKKLLVRYDVEEIFRHSYVAKYDIFDIETRTSTTIQNGAKLQYCSWSPIKDRLSYVYDNNVYIHFEAGLETKLTSDGVDGVIYNGIPDWVYEEEVLSSGSAMWWSPDGLKLAVGFFNDTNVETFRYFLYGDANDSEYQYPKEIELKYPKPGTKNPAVALRIFDFSSVEPTSIRLTAPVEFVTEDHILQNVAWKDGGNLLITWLNRRQNVSSLQLCSTAGVCEEVYHFEEPDGWIMISSPTVLSEDSCAFRYWIDNWYQIWNLNLTTKTNTWKSRGNFTIISTYGYDRNEDKLYYLATLPNDPSTSHVFSNDKCLTCDLLDLDGSNCTSATASFSKNFSYYAVVCNGPNPRFSSIVDTKTNSRIKLWQLNSNLRSLISTKKLPTIKFLNVTLADGQIGYAKLKFPPNLDENKKYPMIVYVYGGPNSVRVTDTFSIGFDNYITTNREIIYAQIDGRGTGYKGKKLLFSVNNNLGEKEVEDQLYVTKYLQTLFPFIDSNRIGIWGWSYGGYITAKTIGNDTSKVFQCGISVAPVTSWIYYDTIYTERYMGLPTAEDNEVNYDYSSVLKNVDNFKTHNFLLVHGSGDDNVHYQQSLVLAKVLQHNDILFEQMTYTDENHSIGNFLPHLYQTMDQFWDNCFSIDVDD